MAHPRIRRQDDTNGFFTSRVNNLVHQVSNQRMCTSQHVWACMIRRPVGAFSNYMSLPCAAKRIYRAVATNAGFAGSFAYATPETASSPRETSFHSIAFPFYRYLVVFYQANTERQLKVADTMSQQPIDEWPRCCRYSEQLTVDNRQIAALLDTDTRYAATWHLVYVCTSGEKVTTATTSANDNHEDGIFSSTVGNSQLLVVFVRKQRRWGPRSTSSVISLHEAFWRKFLATFNILPSFLLLEHSNNGGSFFHTTTEHGHADATAEAASCRESPESALAIHLGYKIGNWYGEEKSIYARQGLRTGQSFVLAMGVDKFDQGEDRIRSLLQANPNAHLLHVVHALQSYSYGTVEFARYQRDYRIQEFEAADGVLELSMFSQDRAKGFRPKASPDNKRLRGTAVCIRNLASGSARGRIMGEQFLLHLEEYAVVTREGAYALAKPQLKGLQEATKLLIELGRHQRDQIEELYSRALALIDVRKVAMARRDIQINLDIAAAAKHDSELMRGIAAVTMVFYPAPSWRHSSAWCFSKTTMMSLPLTGVFGCTPL